MIPEGKLEGLVRRQSELDALLCDPALQNKPKDLLELNRERQRLEPIVLAFKKHTIITTTSISSVKSVCVK